MAEPPLPSGIAVAGRVGEEEAVLGWLDGGGDVDAITDTPEEKRGLSLLMICSQHGQAALVDALLDRGAAANLQSVGGTALLYSVLLNHHAIAERLLAGGAGINECDIDGKSALMLAAIRGHERSLAVLLRNGAAVDMQDRDGFTALIYAVYYNRPEIVSRLLRAGSDSEVKTSKGNTALQRAKKMGHTECARLLKGHAKEMAAQRRRDRRQGRARRGRSNQTNQG